MGSFKASHFIDKNISIINGMIGISFFQRQRHIPIFRQTSATRVPVSAWRRAKAICSSVNFDFFIGKASLQREFCQKTNILSGSVLRDEAQAGLNAPSVPVQFLGKAQKSCFTNK